MDSNQTLLTSVFDMSKDKSTLTIKPNKVTFRGKIAEGTFIPFVTCSTAGGTAAKTVGVTGFTLTEGRRVTVKFSNANTAASPTLNVSSTGAKSIRYKGQVIPTSLIESGSIFDLIYDGANWEILNLSVPFASATAPSSPFTNQVWFDTTNLLIKYWSGSAWVSFGAVYK